VTLFSAHFCPLCVAISSNRRQILSFLSLIPGFHFDLVPNASVDVVVVLWRTSEFPPLRDTSQLQPFPNLIASVSAFQFLFIELNVTWKELGTKCAPLIASVASIFNHETSGPGGLQRFLHQLFAFDLRDHRRASYHHSPLGPLSLLSPAGLPVPNSYSRAGRWHLRIN
jgi:hypothetical protein